jgi:Mg-chelatase subunit ChlD
MRHFTLKIALFGMVIAIPVLRSTGWAQNPSPAITVSQVTVAADGTSKALVSPVDEKGKVLRGLEAANFQLIVDGQVVKPTSLTPARFNETPLSVVLAVDVSGSMHGAGIEAAITGASAFVDRLGNHDICALETFGNSVRQVVDFTDDHEQIKRALAELKATDMQTHLYQAAFDSLDRAGNAPTKRSVVILLTDGKDEGSALGLPEVLSKITSREVPIYTLAYGESVDEETLKRLAAASHGKAFLAPQAMEVTSTYLDIAEELQNDYLLTWNQPALSSRTSQVTITLLYRGEVSSAMVTINPGMVASASGSQNVSPKRARRWPWLLGIVAAAIAFGLLGYWRSLRLRVPELAATMVPPKVWLEVVKGADVGQRLIVFDKDAVIGRDPQSAQIVIKSDPLVGRKHVRLRQNEQGQYVLEDLKSHNGVAVNGIRISEPVTLQSEDRIVIGLTELVFIDQS